MNKQIGKVIEVFIPTEYDGLIVDKMYSTKIGFKVQVENEVFTILEDQNDINTDILREDKVIITIDNNKCVNIKRYMENNYE